MIFAGQVYFPELEICLSQSLILWALTLKFSRNVVSMYRVSIYSPVDNAVYHCFDKSFHFLSPERKKVYFLLAP